ncbi:MAG: NUDIX domain-containing protein [Alphaproteobacteria bacterium]|nr:NUDIX domain-containing protein [Alphaproteobacteria bacterium]
MCTIQKIKDFFYWEVYNRLKGNNQDVVCAVVIHNGKILAQTAQRNAVIHTDDTQYVTPGGKVETGETLNAAVHRELKEETNLNVDVIKKLGSIRNNKYKLHWFVCRPTDVSQLEVVEPLKQKELKWVSLNDASVNWTPKNAEALQQFKAQIEKIQQTPPEVL